jgi:hypothetical protein
MSPQTVKEILASDVHFFEKCDAVARYQKVWVTSERTAAIKLGISKSQIHRMNKVSGTSRADRKTVMDNGADFNTVYLMETKPLALREKVISGVIKTHKQAMEFLKVQKDPKKLARKNEFERIQNKYNQAAG